MKVNIASIHMSNKALLWHQSFMNNRQSEGWPSWEEDKTAILARFCAGPFDDPLAELMKLSQIETIEHYQEAFDSLLNRVELHVNHAISSFPSGLNDEIQHSVRMFKPQTMHDDYCLAKPQEATLEEQKLC